MSTLAACVICGATATLTEKGRLDMHHDPEKHRVAAQSADFPRRGGALTRVSTKLIPPHWLDEYDNA